MQKVQLAAALVAALGFAMHGTAHACPTGSSSDLGVKETKAPSTLSAPTDLGEKGKEGSCKGKDGSCKGKDGSCKGKEGSCKGKDGSCKGKDGSCKGKDGSCKGKEGGAEGGDEPKAE